MSTIHNIEQEISKIEWYITGERITIKPVVSYECELPILECQGRALRVRTGSESSRPAFLLFIFLLGHMEISGTLSLQILSSFLCIGIQSNF